ncbi:MAG: Uma2 family endonuclease [Blastocatellia bacterium]|nr:Uma2 family endonuclease [Blastocatellia bacterium]MBL8193612.1 Uma2 family endonuclease [Blastocatellia bacterium]
MSSQPKKSYTLEEYFEIERNSQIKYEYWDGQIFAMSGASPEHNKISVNLTIDIGSQLRSRSCELFHSDQRVKVPTWPPYRYPDLVALCGKPEYQEIGGVKALLNPSLIIEILSPSTEAFDRGDKFSYYKSIPTFCEYILVAQHRPHITQIIKQSDNKWLLSEVNELTESIYLTSIDCSLKLSDIYLGVEFPPANQNPVGGLID